MNLETPVPERNRRGPLRQFINRLEVDQATFYSLCFRLWQFMAGPVSLILIGSYFTEHLQGYFYTFAYLIGLQTFFELGLHIVIVNIASHEWTHLHFDEQGRIQGDSTALSRLLGLGRWMAAWYGVAAVLFAIGVGIGGALFLAPKDDGTIGWLVPWLIDVVLAAVLLWQQPFVALLEACGQIAVVNRFRLYQAITGSLVVWSGILLGLGLWVTVLAVLVQVAWNCVLLFYKYRNFSWSILRESIGPRMHWRREILPMQWRLGISGVIGYFAICFVPVMWHYHGASAAGQMGMTWQLATVLQAIALAWVQTRTPLFGRLIAKQDYRELDRVFFRLVAVSFGVVVFGATALSIAVWGLNLVEPRLGRRLIPPLATTVLMIGIVCYHIPHCQALYIRAHKRDPLFLLSVVSGSMIAGTVWWLGSHYGPLGAAAGYTAIVAGIILPCQSIIWWQIRREHEIRQ